MPAKNTIKTNTPETYYHVYSRGVAKQLIFLDEQDYLYFCKLFSRYLSPKPTSSSTGVQYPHLRGSVELLAYCLMPNHFHLLTYQKDVDALSTLMRSVMTAYSKYFNLKYKRTGPVFESRFKAKAIDTDHYLQHISRYIHMNPRYYTRYKYSSYGAYVGAASPTWLQHERITAAYGSGTAYATFCSDYIDRREVLTAVKHELADH